MVKLVFVGLLGVFFGTILGVSFHLFTGSSFFFFFSPFGLTYLLVYLVF